MVTHIEVWASVLRSDQECQRRYGRNWKKKLLRGKVVSSSVQRVKTNSLRTTFITGKYYFDRQLPLVDEVIVRHVLVSTSPWESDSSETEDYEEQEGEEEHSEDDFLPDVSNSLDSSASSVPQMKQDRNLKVDVMPGWLLGCRPIRLLAKKSCQMK